NNAYNKAILDTIAIGSPTVLRVASKTRRIPIKAITMSAKLYQEILLCKIDSKKNILWYATYIDVSANTTSYQGTPFCFFCSPFFVLSACHFPNFVVMCRTKLITQLSQTEIGRYALI